MQLLLKIKPQYFFIVAALFFQWQFNRVTPPLQAPDEFNHFYRVLQIADGQLMPLKQDQRLGGYVPSSVREFILPYNNAATNLKYTLSEKQIENSKSIKYNSGDPEFFDYPNTSLYSPVSYLPQSLTLWVLKKFDVTIYTLYYAGRFVTFLLWLILMFYAIKLIPFGKWALTFMLLLPMNLYMVNSYSADTMTNILAILFFVYTLKLAFQAYPIKKQQILFMLMIIVLLALAKVVYVGLVLLILLIPKKQFSSTKNYAIIISAILLVAVISAYMWSNAVLSYYIPYDDYNKAHRDGIILSNCANYYQQKELILSNKIYFLKVIYRSLFEHPFTYLNGYVGVFGNSDIFISKTWIWLTYPLLLLIVFFEKNDLTLNRKQRIVLIISAVSALILLLLSQHLTWDCVGEGIVDLLQGRYLIPLIPVLAFTLSNKLYLKHAYVVVLVCFIIPLNLISVNEIHKRYFVESYSSKTEFFCDAEKVNAERVFLTSNDSIFLEGGQFRTDSFANSGKHSAVLNYWGRYNMIYKFKDLKRGDLIEMSGWKFGSGGNMVISGSGKNCDPFFYVNSKPHFKNSKGWEYLNLAYTIPTNCDSSSVSFFIWNSDSTKVVYFDDIYFSIKKFKGNYIDSVTLVK